VRSSHWEKRGASKAEKENERLEEHSTERSV